MKKVITYCAVLALVTALPAIAADNGGHIGMMKPNETSNRGGMMRVSGSTEATGQAIINSVDAEKKMVNLTHGPMPALDWPEMTMDLPVTSGVELTDVKPGDAVLFRLVLGEDQVYRITKMDVMR